MVAYFKIQVLKDTIIFILGGVQEHPKSDLGEYGYV